MKKLYSFIFPIYNESVFLESQLNMFLDFANKEYKNMFEIILVENGSSDNSWSIAKKLDKRYDFISIHHFPYASYGTAIRWGIINAIGQKIFVLNVDYFDFNFIKKANKLLDTIDIVIGSKTLTSSDDRRSILRRMMTYFFNVFLRLILNYPGTDTHGIKAFRWSHRLINIAKECRTQNELFDTELVLRLTKHGAIFVDLPQRVVELRKSRYFGTRRIRSTLNDLFAIIKTKYLFRSTFFCSLIDADDFGMSDKVNEAIIDEAKSMLIDIVSIMPNLVQRDDLKELRLANGSIAYSMHFNLLRGTPCAGRNKVKSLVGSDGKFYNFFFFMIRLHLGLIKMEDIKTEFYAQYEHLLKLGIKPIYLNSEQHIHIFSPMNKLLEEEIERTSITKIRSISSSFYSLNDKFIRKVILLVIKKMCEFRFGKFSEFKKCYKAYIVHPGS